MAMNPFLASVMANATGNLLSDIIEGVVHTLGEHTGLLEEPVLKTAAEMLRALRDDNEHRVQQNQSKTASRWYNQWLSSVTEILQKLERLQAECEKERSLLVQCAMGPKLSEKVRNVLCRVENLLQGGKFSDDFLVDKPAEPVMKLRSVPDITGFPTLQRSLEDILVLLSCEGVRTVVIWGPLGVGKTTIMQNLNNHQEVAKMFQQVIWFTMTDKEERTMEKMQMQIADRLKLNLAGSNRDEVAESISKELKDKRYLLLLDDVRSPVDHDQLLDIGLPLDNENGSKVVLTTEARRVCFEMKSVRDVEVEKLTPCEAWEMFKQVVTDQRIKIPGVKPVAQRVSKECGGLPLVIKTVAGYFKYKESVAEWRNGLEELRNGSEVEIPRLTQIHSFLKCSYDDLRDVNKKRCFLYGALHPPDTNISADYLVKCWAAERFLGNIDDGRSFRSACDKGYDILRYLANVSLLRAGKRMEHVQVNNVVRQVAIHISSEDRDCQFLVGHPTETSVSPQKISDWEQAMRVFMIDAKLKDLPNLPRCDSLLSLLLQRNPDLKTIPPSFFRTMPKLQVLNICRTGIVSLPPSFAKLTQLKALFLGDCVGLTFLPLQFGQLRLLEVLDIRNCKVAFMPLSIGNLVSLRCLRVSYYKPDTLNDSQMEVDNNVIPRLCKLEELVIDVISYDQWCDDAGDVIIQQVASLENLTSLRICFPNPEVLSALMERKPEWQGREQLSSFWSFIGHQNNNPSEILDYFSHPIERYLRYDYDRHPVVSTSSNVFPETDVLELTGHYNISCLSEFIQVRGLNGIIGCLVERCSNMVTIVDESSGRSTSILPSLQQLLIRNLLDLKNVFEGSLSGGSLSELITIAVRNCPMLTSISPNGLLQQLPKLAKLSVQSCEIIEEVISDSRGNGSMQNLQVLELLDLKNLQMICSDESLTWPKLKELRVLGCEKLKTLPFNRQNAAGLKLIKAEQAWWDELLNNEFKEHFQSFGILKLM